ncbi:hypothetical protein [Raoultella ornithinolytica]|uniref:hypothetical protein n=1 Tax=Raoultella ornithinolytica TaxID=54291 RepID=UPI000B4C7135|nr:hypothetical protein [Raoultella ornithinolytica]OWP43343.1 hypothetical protein CEG93_07615 [Raoultella ornithinolytica]
MTENSTIHAQNCRTDIGIGKQVTASVKGYVDGHLYMINITVHPVEITFDFGEEKIMRGSYFSSKNQEMVWAAERKELTISDEKGSFTIAF